MLVSITKKFGECLAVTALVGLLFGSALVIVWLATPLVSAQTTTPPPAALTISPNPAQTDDLVTAQVDLGADSSNNIFTWYINKQKRSDLSGLGKSIAIFIAPSNTSASLSIRVDYGLLGAATTTLTETVPVVLSPATKAFQQMQNQFQDLTTQQADVETHISADIRQSPENAGPGETVTLIVSSLSANLDNATITWFFNGKRISSGIGNRNLTVQLGPSGSANDARADIVLADGRQTEAFYSITPLGVTFYWWSNTHIPPWYRGKSLPTPGSLIFIQARPSFPDAVASALLYTWFVDDAPVTTASGQGKSILSYAIPDDGQIVPIRVRITNISKTVNQEAEFGVPVQTPELWVYETRPFEGIVTAIAIKTIARPAGKTLEFVAEPFFVATSLLKDLEYQWTLNGATLENDKTPTILRLLSRTDTTGTQTVNVSFGDQANRVLRLLQSFQVNLQ